MAIYRTCVKTNLNQYQSKNLQFYFVSHTFDNVTHNHQISYHKFGKMSSDIK